MATKRENVISWVDCKVLTKLCCEIQTELTEYASRGYEKNGVYGDSNVFVALINIQKRIEELRTKAEKARERAATLNSIPAGGSATGSTSS